MRRRLLYHEVKHVPVGSYIYKNLVISAFEYTDVSASGADSLLPTLTYSYEQWRCEDGVEVEKVATINKGDSNDIATVSFSISNKRDDVTFNSSTGAISCNASSSYDAGTYDKLGDVTVKVTVSNTDIDDLTAEKTTEVLQAANSDDPIVKTEYSIPEIVLVYDTAKATDTELDYTTFTYKQTRTNTYASGKVGTTEITTLGSGDSVVFSLINGTTGTSVNASTGKLTFNANTVESQITLGTVSVTVVMNGQEGTGEYVVYQEAAEATYDTSGTIVITQDDLRVDSSNTSDKEKKVATLRLSDTTTWFMYFECVTAVAPDGSNTTDYGGFFIGTTGSTVSTNSNNESENGDVEELAAGHYENEATWDIVARYTDGDGNAQEVSLLNNGAIDIGANKDGASLTPLTSNSINQALRLRGTVEIYVKAYDIKLLENHITTIGYPSGSASNQTYSRTITIEYSRD